MPRTPIPRRGDVWLVSLDPTIGHEVQKTRPAVAVTSDIYNRHNWVVIVMPLTPMTAAKYNQVLIEPPEGGVASASVTLPDKSEPWTADGWSIVWGVLARVHWTTWIGH